MSAASLGDRTSPEAAAAADRVLVVPVGATEQHGPHLPLSTDTDLAVALADAVARGRDDVVVAPAVAYGSSGEHQAFSGTLSIGRDALLLLLVELVRSATETFGRVLLVSTHGGNAAPVRDAVALLRDEGRDVRAWSPEWGGDAHAGHVETSLVLALTPDRVRGGGPVGDRRPLRDVLPELRRGGVAAVSANGVLGDATTAHLDAGRTLLRRATADLDRTIARWG
ncbi:MAG: mycofactocin biosynthesis peptidyl-dipeptidase MftE [Solirubrobacteraceae bacterium]|nr:mycofactocin biosynthesis peptidyl-dipeptidase MftE [Solirubrobacteraceae bacterium]